MLELLDGLSNFVLLAQEAAAPAAPLPSAPVFPIPWWGVLQLVVIVVIFGLALVSGIISGRTGVIAHATMKEAVRQPMFALLMALALVLLVINTFLPFFSLGEDVKMQIDCGLATILVCSLLLSVWTSSNSIANEIEGKTAMTLLSKPVTRQQFIVGKYLGIVKSTVVLMAPLCIVFLALIYYKVFYDAKEASGSATAPEAVMTMLQVIPGLALIFLEVCVLAAVSVAISTRLPMMVNIVSCFAIFIVGHLTPMLVEAGVLRLEFVSFMARLIATVLPALEVFNIQAAVATGTAVPPLYLLYAALYSTAYAGAAILMAFVLFEDRDLA